jgi:hypothetical protein
MHTILYLMRDRSPEMPDSSEQERITKLERGVPLASRATCFGI